MNQDKCQCFQSILSVLVSTSIHQKSSKDSKEKLFSVCNVTVMATKLFCPTMYDQQDQMSIGAVKG